MKTLSAVFTFVKDNFWIVLFGGIMLACFMFTGHFGELIYSAMKFAFIVVLAALFLHWKFPATIHKYINEDALKNEFWGTDPKHRLNLAFGMMAVLFLICAICFH